MFGGEILKISKTCVFPVAKFGPYTPALNQLLIALISPQFTRSFTVRTSLILLLVIASFGCNTTMTSSDSLNLTLRSRDKTTGEISIQDTKWDPKKTALVICDMWDDHWCKGAAKRVVELTGPVNQLVEKAREQGVFIVHAPSSTVSFYDGTLQRKLAQEASFHKTPKPLSTEDRWGTKWCYPDKERGEPEMPIDDSDMGCDCKEKCEIRSAWTRQIKSIDIKDGDAITDNGQEVYNLYKERGIENVIICGVHLNMCVLGRPFAIRQMVQQGMNVALVRDLTDTMYNSQKAPFVNHFSGTDLVVAHVEKYWCPSFESSDILGGKAFVFSEDKR